MTWREFLLALHFFWRISPHKVQCILEREFLSPEVFVSWSKGRSFATWWSELFGATPVRAESEKLWREFYAWLEKSEFEKSQFAVQKRVKFWEAKGFIACTRVESAYPSRLLQLEAPPSVLWWTRTPHFRSPITLAVVGSRAMSDYGAQATHFLTKELVESFQANIVSGCARGIDLVAHQTALKSGGESVGFLGCGLDQMSRQVRTSMEKGWVVSEFLPDEKVQAWHFQQRNRLIAGIAEAVIIIEAQEKSGTMITAQAALDQGKTVFVMGQPFYGKNRAGVTALVRSGATLIHSASEIMHELRGTGVAQNERTLETLLDDAATEAEQAVIRWLWEHQGKSFAREVAPGYLGREEVWRQTLYILEAKGLVMRQAGVVALSCMIHS